MDNKRPLTYVFDLDGVIYRGNEPQPHASETLLELARRGHKIFFLTNNATKSRKDYQDKLQGMNIPAQPNQIVTSAYATSLFIKEQGKEKPKAFVVGEAGLIHELESVGVEIVEDVYQNKVDYVVVGLDRGFNYKKLTDAQYAILSGATFIATNPDATYPLEEGKLAPGSGAVVSAVETATSTKPVVIGKPHSYAVKKVLELADATPATSIMIGDRLDTDIAAGNRMKMHTVLVLTGISSLTDAINAPAELKPQHIIPDLEALLNISVEDE